MWGYFAKRIQPGDNFINKKKKVATETKLIQCLTYLSSLFKYKQIDAAEAWIIEKATAYRITIDTGVDLLDILALYGE